MGDYRAAPTAGAYQTTVQLLRVPLRIDDENQMYFANQTAQNNYFQSVIWKSLPSQTYQRENAYFRVDDDYDAIVTNCNYLRYKNAITGNKWFYAYITEFEYKNPNTTFVHFKIDAYQTYLFNITWKDCFIEREHVKDDGFGKNIIPDIDVGEPDIKRALDMNLPLGLNNVSIDLVPILLFSEQPGNTAVTYPTTAINGVLQGMYYWFSASALGDPEKEDLQNTISDFNNLRNWLIKNKKINTLIGAFYVPRFALSGISHNSVVLDEGVRGGEIITGITQKSSDVSLSFALPLRSFDDYIPNNNKLYTSQYYRCNIINHQGTGIVLKPEYLRYVTGKGWTIEYKLSADISPDSTIYFTIQPTYNNGLYANANKYYKIMLTHFPVPSIAGDYFSAWLSSHSSSVIGNLVASASQLGIGAIASATPGAQLIGAGMISGSLASISNTLASVYDASKVADPALVQTSSTSLFANEYAIISAYLEHLNYDAASRVDNYFTMFGYKVNELKVPEFATRKYYNYYKMSVCNITGNIPQTALDEIRAKFQRGITLWNTPDVGNYRNGNNPIVTS